MKAMQRNMNKIEGNKLNTVRRLGSEKAASPVGDSCLCLNTRILRPLFFVVAIIWSVQSLAGSIWNSRVFPTATCHTVPVRAVNLWIGMVTIVEKTHTESEYI